RALSSLSLLDALPIFIERLQSGGFDAVVGYRIRRADPLVRTVYARLYSLANRIFFRLTVRDIDCASKLFTRASLEGVKVESGGRSEEHTSELQSPDHL